MEEDNVKIERVSGWEKYLDLYYWWWWFRLLLWRGRPAEIVEVCTIDIPDDSELAKLLRG